MACSTQDVFSFKESSKDCWLMTDKNFRINLVLSVLPAPLSPLKDKMQKCVPLGIVSFTKTNASTVERQKRESPKCPFQELSSIKVLIEVLCWGGHTGVMSASEGT